MDKLDKNIKNLFEDYRVDYDPHSWDAMENKINSELIDNEGQFDKDLQNKINNYTEVYDHTSWPILEEKMMASIAIRKKIWTTKCLEALVILLLIFSIVNYSNTPILPKNQIKFADNNATQQNAKSTDLEITSIETLEPASTLSSQHSYTTDNLITNSSAIISKGAKNKAVSNIALNNAASATGSNPNTQKYFASDLGNNRDHLLANTLSDIVNVEKKTSNSKSNDSYYESDNGSDHIFRDPLSSSTEVVLLESYIIKGISSDIKQLTYDRDITLELPAISLNTPIRKVLTKEKYIGVVASLDVNLINRPLDFQLLQDPINYGDLGYSFGVLYASKLGRHEIETGLLYSLHSTNPNQTEKISIENSYYDRQFYLQKFDLFKIPLDFKYHIVDSEENNLYASLGMDLHIIGDATYKFEDNLKSGTHKPQYKIESRSTLEKRKDLKGGLFDGGTLQNNSFINVGGGLGYIRKMGSYSIFGEVNYKHHIFAAKLGPNNENINSLSFKIGARKRV